MLGHILYSTLNNRCPRCHGDKVFKTNNAYDLKNAFTMNKSCGKCGLSYDKEPGYFYGAMFVSYGLSAGWLTLWYLLNIILLHVNVHVFVLAYILSIIVLMPLNFRWSRLIWINFFDKYQGDRTLPS